MKDRWLIVFVFLGAFLTVNVPSSAQDPLPSWNDGPVKSSIG